MGFSHSVVANLKHDEEDAIFLIVIQQQRELLSFEVDRIIKAQFLWANWIWLFSINI